MYNDRIAAALIEARHQDLRGRIDRERPRRAPRPRPHLPRVVFALRTLRARS